MTILPSDILKKIGRIHIQTTHLANDVLAGAYRSAFKGKGMEFEEVREYQSGDDVRSIDWNVTARMNRLYVKNFREERELNVILAVDVSASTRFGSGEALKSDLIAEIASVLAFSALKNQDKVALLLFSSKIEKYFPPQKGTRHVLRLIRELLTYRPKEKGTDISGALSFLGKVQDRAAVCFLISDFICPDFTHEAALAAKRYDLVPIAIADPTEKVFPKMGLVTMIDLETEAVSHFDSFSVVEQNNLSKNLEARLSRQRKIMQSIGVKFCIINSHIPYLKQLKKYFILRGKRCS